MFGVGTGIGTAAILNVGDAIFAPLAARQQLRARQADRQAASNDTLVAVSDAYFNVQQARGELAGAVAATQRTEELVARTRKLAPAIVPELETRPGRGGVGPTPASRTLRTRALEGCQCGTSPRAATWTRPPRSSRWSRRSLRVELIALDGPWTNSSRSA